MRRYDKLIVWINSDKVICIIWNKRISIGVICKTNTHYSTRRKITWCINSKQTIEICLSCYLLTGWRSNKIQKIHWFWRSSSNVFLSTGANLDGCYSSLGNVWRNAINVELFALGYVLTPSNYNTCWNAVAYDGFWPLSTFDVRNGSVRLVIKNYCLCYSTCLNWIRYCYCRWYQNVNYSSIIISWWEVGV